MKPTEPVSPRFPPCLENMDRTFEAVRFLLSVIASTITATPFGRILRNEFPHSRHRHQPKISL